jgi:hypothetical protein
MTYSINTSTNTESNSLDISDSSQFDLILNRLKDNLDGLINPVDIRDTLLSTWSNISFKETKTTGSNNSYIGLDSGNPSNRDVKLNIHLGKRSNSGIDILDNISDDSDIYIYNTKTDNIQNDSTKVSFLAGIDTSLFLNSPYIRSKVVIGPTSSFLSMDIINNTANLNIESSQSFVRINNIDFPELNVSASQSINGKVLTYRPSQLEWDDINVQLGDNIGITGSTLSFLGEINVNGYSLSFTDNRFIPINIGDINIGENFSNYSISEILKRIIYQYQPPSVFLSILPPFQTGYVEWGTSPNITIEYTINKKTLPTLTATLNNMIPGNYPPITTTGYQTINGVASAFLITPIGDLNNNQSVTISVSDGIQNSSFSRSIIGVYPYFHGVTQLAFNQSITSPLLTKLIDGRFTRTLSFLGNGIINYIYPASYGTLSDITDSSGFSVLNDFTNNNILLSASDGLWSGVQYTVYTSNNTYNFLTPESFTFIFT